MLDGVEFGGELFSSKAIFALGLKDGEYDQKNDGCVFHRVVSALHGKAWCKS